MAITLTGDGLQYDGGDEMKQRMFHYRNYHNSTYTYDTSGWKDGWTTSNYAIPANSRILVRYLIPCRNDAYGTWGGGHYSRFYYSINDGGWNDLGHSGYSSCMHQGSGSITRYTAWHHLDFSGSNSDFNIKFLWQHLAHQDSGQLNGNSIASGSGSTAHADGASRPHAWHIMIDGYVTT